MERLTQKFIKELFYYREDGVLIRIKSKGRKAKAGCIAGYKTKNGYTKVKINSKCYLRHQLNFLYHHGYMPKCTDHIDGNTENDRIENLQEVTYSQNAMKARRRPANISGHTGVFFDKKSNKWRSQIFLNGVSNHLGSFKNKDDAIEVRRKAEDKYFKGYIPIDRDA